MRSLLGSITPFMMRVMQRKRTMNSVGKGRTKILLMSLFLVAISLLKTSVEARDVDRNIHIVSWRLAQDVNMGGMLPTTAAFAARLPRKAFVPTSAASRLQSHALQQCTTKTSTALSLRGGASESTSVFQSFTNYLQSSKRRSWTLLLVCVLLDTGSTVLMKSNTTTSGSKLPRALLAFTGYFLSLSGLAVALHSIDVSIAYAVWAALGTAIVSTAGILLFGERCDTTKIICLLMIVGGVVGLELSDQHA